MKQTSCLSKTLVFSLKPFSNNEHKVCLKFNDKSNQSIYVYCCGCFQVPQIVPKSYDSHHFISKTLTLHGTYWRPQRCHHKCTSESFHKVLFLGDQPQSLSLFWFPHHWREQLVPLSSNIELRTFCSYILLTIKKHQYEPLKNWIGL